jgi:glycerophosphoryl diester phosphodiesterase
MKIWDNNYENLMIDEIIRLVKKYDVEKHVYFMTTNDTVIKTVMDCAPNLRICVGWDGNQDPMSMVDRAVKLGAYKIQLFKPYFNQETIIKAHENGILCNVFFSDDPQEAVEMLKQGIDCILTNDYLAVKNAVDEYLNE